MFANFITCIFACATSLSFDVKDLLLHMVLFMYYLFAYDIWVFLLCFVLLHSDDINMILLLFVRYVLNLEDIIGECLCPLFHC